MSQGFTKGVPIDTDATLSANSNLLVPSQFAVRTYVTNQIAAGGGGSSGVPTTRTIGTTAPLTGGGDLSADRTLSIPAATTSANGYLSAADFTSFTNGLTDRRGGNFYRKSQRWYVPSDNANNLSTSNHSAPSVFFVPFPVHSTIVIDQIAVELTTAGSAGSFCRFGIYQGSAATVNPTTLITDSGDIPTTLTPNVVKTFTPPTPITLTPGLYFTAFSTNSATPFGVRNLPVVNFAQVIGTVAPGNVNLGTYINGVRATYGALPSNAATLTLNPTTGPIYALFYRIL
jgi:hypothetical protein